MQIIEGKYNGFCFGVQRAIETAQKLANEKGKAYTYGPITHNKEVIRWLNDQSVFCVESDEDVLRLQENDTIIIRSHGVSPKVFQSLIARGLYVEDVTCPFVKYAQNAAKRMYEENRIVIIAGQSDHPEIIGINGYTGNHAIILETPSYVENLPPMQRVGILAQTTFYSQRYEEILDVLRKKCLDLLVERTICSTTEDRQKEALELGASCNAIVVIGGKHSSNTQKLYSLCKSRNQNVQIVENQQDLNVEILPINGIIGVVAGASTPQWSIREVLTRMSEFDNTVQNTEESTPVAETIEVAVVDSTEENAVSTEESVDVIESAALESDGAEQEDPVTSEGSEHASADEVTEEVANAEVSNTDESDEPELSAEESFERDVEKTMIRIRPGQVKNGTVVSIVGDDVYVNIGYKADGIIHQKELSLDPDAKASELFQVGDEVRVEIIRVNDGEGNVLLSKKKVALKEKEREAIAELEDGQHFEVAVKQAVKGGLLAEFLTARVFIPASHVAERFVENMEEFVGKKMLVKALEVDKNKKRIVASHREVVKDEAVKARKEIYSRFEPGQRVKGIVRRLTNFGAFTDIGGVDGLIHVTDLSWGRVRHPEDIVQVNQEVEVEILSVNPENERIALGYKQLQPKPWDNALERYVPGDIIEGRVDRMAPFGAFVEIEPGLFGLVHISQVATNRIEKVEDELQVGDIITVKVLDINPETKRISLSRRAVLQEARTQQILAEREQNRNRSGQNEEEHFHYTIPKVEETTFTLGDLFGQVDVADIDVTDIVEDSLMEDPE